MIEAKRRRPGFYLLAGVMGLLVGAIEADAALQSRAGGQAYYDDVADLTWASVASSSTNPGATTGLDWFGNHQSWVDAHTIDGVGGWRMPRADVNGDGIVLAACAEHLVCRDNEMGYLYAAHGVTQLAPFPFDLHGAASFFSASVSSGTVYHEFNFSTGENAVRNAATNRGFAMLVQTGDVLGVPGSEGPDLITNGSFENGVTIAPATFLANLGVGNGGITDWNIRSGNVDYIESLWQASNGGRSLDMSGSTWGSIFQTIPTVSGHRYRVRFDLAGNPSGGPSDKRLRVTAADQLQVYDFDTTGRSTSDMGWTAHAFEFTASDSTTDIYFVSLTSGGFGPTLDNVRAFDLGPPPQAAANGASLETIEVFQFELIYNDSNSGASKDGAFHQPLVPPGYYGLSHQGQSHHNVPGFGGAAGRSVLAVKPLEPDALAPPASFVWIWDDEGSGAALSASAWRPVPPPGYACLGTFLSREWISPDVSTHPATLRDLSKFRCVRSDLVVEGVANARIWDDAESGGDHDFSAWSITASDSAGLAVGGILGSTSYDTPTDTVYVLDASFVRTAERPALADGPYLELDMLRDRQVSGACDWNPAIYNDSGTDANVDVAWWHPQNIPAGYHQLGHTYERFHNPACSVDPLIVAQERVTGALAAPIGWDNDLTTPAVDPVWDDMGSGGGNNGAIWRPNPPPGYVCLGSFATGGYGYVPPDHPNYVNFVHPINQAVAAAAQNFRCVREDLTVPARVSEVGWTDHGSGAARDLAMYEVDPAEYTGMDVGIDVGHFVGVNAYRMPLEQLRTINARAVADVAQLSQAEFDLLLAKGPILQLHPQERYAPDDPIYTLDNQVSLCSGSIPNEGHFYGLPFNESTGQTCDLVVTDIVGIPDGINFEDCTAFEPNSHPDAPNGAGDGSFYGSSPQCIPAASITADNLYGHVANLQSSTAAQDPSWRMWLEIDNGPPEPPYGTPLNPTGDSDRTRVVVRVRPWNGIGHEVQYWIWYPYNGPGKFEAGCGGLDDFHFTPTTGRHQGDWEVVSLRYDEEGDLAEVYLSAHDAEDVVSVKPTATTLNGPIESLGLQPIVYSARDSHANYRGPGAITYKEPFSLDIGLCTVYLRLKDLTEGGPPATQIDLSLPSRLIIASSEFPEIATVDPVPYWLDFPGRWGGYEAVEFLGEIEFASVVLYDDGFKEVSAGPSGPPFKALWQGEPVPEPSGGLFSGLLALGLLATRRRRERPATTERIRQERVG